MLFLIRVKSQPYNITQTVKLNLLNKDQAKTYNKKDKYYLE